MLGTVGSSLESEVTVGDMSEKSLAIGVIAMQISSVMEHYDILYSDVVKKNESGWLVIFPVELSDGYFQRKRVQLGDDDLAVAWDLAGRLEGCPEPSVKG